MRRQSVLRMDGEDRPDLSAETTFDVLLYIYDLSKDLTKSFKKILKGKPLPAIWHTGLVAYGREYYFGSTGIESCRPGETILGEPDQILKLGKTELPYSVFLEYIFALGESTYKPGSYHLLEHNCNCFSQEVCQFLTGGPIPSEIRELPQEIPANKNLSNALTEYFDKLSLRAEGSRGISFGQEQRNGHSEPPAAPAPKQNGTRRKKSSANAMSAKEQQQVAAAAAPKEPKPQEPSVAEVPNGPPSEEAPQNGQPVASEAAAPQNNGATRLEDAEDAPSTGYVSKRRRYDDPPIIYPDLDGPGLLRQLMGLMEGKLRPEEVRDLEEFMEYLTTDGGAWALGTTHLETFGRFLNDRNLPEEVPVLALKVFQAAGLKEDVILLLHQDREKHYLMSYFYKIEELPVNEQTEVLGLMCNLCSNPSSYDWLTYISEWEEEGKACSNSRVTVRVAVHGLLADPATTRERGCALVFNLALKKELFDDIASELAMAIFQFLQGPVGEELLISDQFQACRDLRPIWRDPISPSLGKTLHMESVPNADTLFYVEIPALMKMMGPDVEAFKGASPRIDPIVEEIQMKLRIAR